MIIDIFLLIYTILLGLITVWAAYSSYLVLRCGVPPVPTNQQISTTMIQAAGLTQKQNVYDLGCGFGDILLNAAKLHPHNTYAGFDINHPVIWIAKIRNTFRGNKVNFVSQDFFTQDLSDADIIFCYLWPSIMQRIENDIWPNLKPGTKIISHAFKLPNVPPTKQLSVRKHKIFVYIR